jgi:hypothetical protein
MHWKTYARLKAMESAAPESQLGGSESECNSDDIEDQIDCSMVTETLRASKPTV